MSESHKIKKISAADLVYDKLKQFILNGAWPPGQKIPTETELAKDLEVNRLTVRIALQRLSALGVLDIRVGDGTYVKAFDMNHQISALSEFYVNSKTKQDVTEYRLALESICVDLAVQRRTDEELQQFYQLCLQFQSDLEKHYLQSDPLQAQSYFQKTVDTSVALHITICEMAHNDLMLYAFTLAKEPMRQHMLFNASNRLQDLDIHKRNIWSKHWFDVYHALQKREADCCKELLQQLIVLKVL